MSDLFLINSCRATVELKEQAEAGIGTSSASTNVTVFLAKSYATLTSVTVTPKPTTSGRYFPGVVFDESRPNPTSFQVFILDSTGARVSVPFSWQVRGSQGADLSLWSPANIGSSLKVWFDGNYPESVTLTSGAVSQWNDRSGGNLHVTQAGASNRPTFVENAINGMSAIRFDGTDDLLEKTSVSIVPRTVYAVARGNAVTGFRRLLQQDSVWLFGAGGAAGNFFYTAMSTSSLNTPNYTVAGNNILGLINNGTTGFPFWNGNAQNTVGGMTTSITAIRIGGFVDCWSGDIGEIIITDSAMSTTDRQKLEGYLAWKWKLEGNLPSNHPFRYVQPLA